MKKKFDYFRSTELSYSDDNIDDFFSTLNIDSSLRTLLNGDTPVWLSLIQQNVDSKNPLTQMKQGLNWAQTLGDAAKNGFKVIYTPINKQTWYEPSMTYYTTLLHKRIIGQTVFDTNIFNGNRFDAHFYAHCTKNMSGSFTMFGVNSADTGLDVTATLPFRSGTEYVEFILTVGVNGKVYLNGAEIVEPTVLTPQTKYKLPGKGAVLSMPANSVAFWVFIGASIPECASVETIPFEFERPEERTSSEILLQQLILDAVSNDEHNAIDNKADNSVQRSKRHAIMTEDASANRNRRDAANNINKHDEYNAIEMKEANFADQIRNKRFIGDGKLANKIYNDFDDLKRANLLAPIKQKLGFPTIRMKRDINVLKNLFDKFDLKKPAFNLKSPLKLKANSFIPSIQTVHDVLKPGGRLPNREKDIFKPVDNPELPSGDVHFELAEELPQQNEYAAALAGGNEGVSQFVEKAAPLTRSQDVYGVKPSLNNAVPSTLLLGELTEMDIKSDIVTSAPVAAVTQVPSVQHQLQLVVKDLPPTWQVNLKNMEKARNNLQRNFWPMNAENPNSKISAILPNASPPQIIQLPEEDEHVFFESKRRRRSIDTKMNDNIDNHLQETLATPKQDTDVDQVELLNKMIRLVDDLERKQSKIFNEQLIKYGGGIRKILANREIERTGNDTPKKCKVLSMAMENQCLQTENQEKSIFKRAAESKQKKRTGPMKKLIAKLKDSVEKPFRFRNRRSIDGLTEQINSEENDINVIQKVLNEEQEFIPRKNVYNRRRYNLRSSTTIATSIASGTSTTKPPTTAEQDSGKLADHKVPKFLRNMKGCINNITSSVVQQVGRWWLALS